jgi:hypothetical protein
MDDEPIYEGRMTWTILLSAPSMEFKIRDTLTLSGVPAYVPVEFRLGKHRHRPIPVAPGYVFAEIEDWGSLRHVEGLRSRPLLMVNGEIATITPAELARIVALSRPLSLFKQDNERFKPGQRIQIQRGSLIAINAIIDRVTKHGRPVAIVEMLGKRHEIIVSEDMIVA